MFVACEARLLLSFSHKPAVSAGLSVGQHREETCKAIVLLYSFNFTMLWFSTISVWTEEFSVSSNQKHFPPEVPT